MILAIPENEVFKYDPFKYGFIDPRLSDENIICSLPDFLAGHPYDFVNYASDSSSPGGFGLRGDRVDWLPEGWGVLRLVLYC